jgi:hypothetical protein
VCNMIDFRYDGKLFLPGAWQALAPDLLLAVTNCSYIGHN